MNDSMPALEHDALAILVELLDWQLSPARWDGVAGVLDSLAASLTDGDLDTFTMGIRRLEEAGPVRIIRIGTVPRTPPPPPVRDRANELIQKLSGGAAAGAEPDAEAGE